MEIVQCPTLIGQKDEKLANPASYVKVIVKQSLGRLKTLFNVTDLGAADSAQTSDMLVCVALRTCFVHLKRQQMGTKRRDTTLETSVLCIMLPISPRFLLRIWI